MKSINGSSLKTINGKKLLSIHVNKSRIAHHVKMYKSREWKSTQ